MKSWTDFLWHGNDIWHSAKTSVKWNELNLKWNVTFSCSEKAMRFIIIIGEKMWILNTPAVCITLFNLNCRGVLTRAVRSLDPLMMSPSLESRQLTSWLWPDNSSITPLLLWWTRILPSLTQTKGSYFRTSLISELKKIWKENTLSKKALYTIILQYACWSIYLLSCACTSSFTKANLTSARTLVYVAPLIIT